MKAGEPMEASPGERDCLPGDGKLEGDSSSVIWAHDSEPWGFLSVASGYGVNGSGIRGHSDVTGHDALVTVEMVRRR